MVDPAPSGTDDALSVRLETSMRKPCLLLFLLAALPAWSGEVGILLDKIGRAHV